MNTKQRLDALERRIAVLEQKLKPPPTPWVKPLEMWPVFPVEPNNCTCPPDAVCGNVACPRRPTVTAETGR